MISWRCVTYYYDMKQRLDKLEIELSAMDSHRLGEVSMELNRREVKAGRRERTSGEWAAGILACALSDHHERLGLAPSATEGGSS